MKQGSYSEKCPKLKVSQSYETYQITILLKQSTSPRAVYIFIEDSNSSIRIRTVASPIIVFGGER